MTTKFDIDEEVLIKARIKKVTIEDESDIYYTVNLESVLDVGPVHVKVRVKETDIMKNDHLEFDLNKGTVSVGDQVIGINTQYTVDDKGRAIYDD